jgi:hypothetical protein
VRDEAMERKSVDDDDNRKQFISNAQQNAPSERLGPSIAEQTSRTRRSERSEEYREVWDSCRFWAVKQPLPWLWL